LTENDPKDNKTHRKCEKSKGNNYSLKRGKWQAATLVNTLRAGLRYIRTSISA